MLKKSLALLLLVAVIGVLVFALTRPELEAVTVPYVPAQSEPAPPVFVAGAATVDITPPPGVLPRAGYAMWSTIGEGFRTRLYARAYYLRDSDGDAQMIIQTDLTTGSRILHTRLAEQLARQTDIDVANLTITTTHTHSAPGQFLGSQFYNKHISSVPGFATGYFEFLLERIGSAALRAYRDQGPASLAIGTREVWGQTRNRSMPAHVENETVSNKSLGDERAYHSVDPTLTMVRIDRLNETGRHEPYAAFALFGIHGTALPRDETLFNADVWAYIHKDWERAVDAAGPVHFSAFEGVHGDVAPAAYYGALGYREARRIGKGIAREAIALYRNLEGKLNPAVDLATAARHVNIREQNRAGHVAICKDAAVGNPLVAGPEEHTSPLFGYLPFLRQGSRDWTKNPEDCQGRKLITGFDFIQQFIEPKDSFPDYVIFQLQQINDTVLVPLPFELSTETGRRLADAVRAGYRAAGRPGHRVALASLAGGYTGYATTPEEYNRQYYEGGHTLYGQYTEPYLAAQLKSLARDFASSEGNLVELPASWTYRFETRRFLPFPTPATGRRELVSEPVFHHPRGIHEGHWRFQWRDVNPSQINLHQPLLSIQVRPAGGDWQPLMVDGIPVNDRGYDMAVRLTGETDENGMAVYTGYWFNPLFDGEDQDYRFVVQPRGGKPVFYSPPFH